MSRSQILAATGLMVAAITLAGCGSDDEAASPASPSTPTAQSDTASPSAAGPTARIDASGTDLGTILVDGDGMTLYMFTNDTQGEPSVCEGDCLAAWPAFEGTPAAGDGVEEDLLGSIDRSDGTPQATYDGWPLYYYVKDQAPGDTTGQGVGGVWFVLAPDGTVVK